MLIDKRKKHVLKSNVKIKFLLLLSVICLVIINCAGVKSPNDNKIEIAGVKNSNDNKIEIAMVVKNMGNSFFDACRDGGQEAAEELGNMKLIYTGPDEPTAEGQIKIIENLTEQQVDAIAISANDYDELVPICRKARKKGIIVISFDSAIAEEGRILQIDPSSDELIGRRLAQLIAEEINYIGEIAYLSAVSQPVSQNY